MKDKELIHHELELYRMVKVKKHLQKQAINNAITGVEGLTVTTTVRGDLNLISSSTLRTDAIDITVEQQATIREHVLSGEWDFETEKNVNDADDLATAEGGYLPEAPRLANSSISHIESEAAEALEKLVYIHCFTLLACAREKKWVLYLTAGRVPIKKKRMRL